MDDIYTHVPMYILFSNVIKPSMNMLIAFIYLFILGGGQILKNAYVIFRGGYQNAYCCLCGGECLSKMAKIMLT